MCYCCGLVESQRETLNDTFLQLDRASVRSAYMRYSSNYIPQMSYVMSMIHDALSLAHSFSGGHPRTHFPARQNPSLQATSR